jgi:group I intron endonuclease
MIGFIYGIKNTVNGRWYVGQTTRHYTIRWSEHKQQLMMKMHHSYKLQRAFDECGPDAFEWSILEEVELDAKIPDLLTRREQSWCAKLKGIKEGYNILPPGKKYVSPEQKKKNREASWKNKPQKKSSKKPSQKKSKKISGSTASATAKKISDKWKKLDGAF